MNDCWHVYLYGIMWRTADANPELPENLRVTVDADSRADAMNIIGNGEQSVTRVVVRPVVGRDAVGGVFGEQGQPVIERPGIQQRRFFI